MKSQDLKKNQLISVGNFFVSIGTHNVTDVALVSKFTGEFVKIQSIKKSNILRNVKRKFKLWLNSDETFTFQFMQPETTLELINFLKR